MANVGTSRDSRQSNQSDRGQLLLIAGLLLAVTFILLAVLLNSVIYAENLGSRGTDIGGGDAIEFETAVDDAGNSIIHSINHEAESGDDHGDLVNDFEGAFESWDSQSRQHRIQDGDYSVVSIDETHAGTQVHHDSGAFLNASGSSDWELAEDVRVRNYSIDIETIHAADPTNGFRLSVENGSDDRELIVYDDGIVAEENGEEIEDCDLDIPESIDFANATVNGKFCEAVIFGGDLEEPYDTIAYENGDQIEGDYQFVADDPDLEDSDDFETRPGIYSANTTVVYETEQIEYNTSREIAPGDHDE